MERMESLLLQLSLVTEALAGMGEEAPDANMDKRRRDKLKKLASVDLPNVLSAIDTQPAAVKAKTKAK